MNVFMFDYVVKAAQTSFCRIIFITTQRNQLMIPMSSCIFSVLCNKGKSKVRRRVSLNSQIVHSILKNRFSIKDPSCSNWLFSISSTSVTGEPSHFMQRSDCSNVYTSLQHWKVFGFYLEKK